MKFFTDYEEESEFETMWWYDGDEIREYRADDDYMKDAQPGDILGLFEVHEDGPPTPTGRVIVYRITKVTYNKKKTRLSIHCALVRRRVRNVSFTKSEMLGKEVVEYDN